MITMLFYVLFSHAAFCFSTQALPTPHTPHALHTLHALHALHALHTLHTLHTLHALHALHALHILHTLHTLHALHALHALHTLHTLPFPVLRNRYPETPVVKVTQPFRENCPLKGPNGTLMLNGTLFTVRPIP